MSGLRTLCFVSGSRAEFGLILPVLREARHRGYCIRLILFASHLSPGQGITASEAADEGFPGAERIESLLASETGTGAAKSLALGLIGLADAFQRVRPDAVVVLGDRYELLAVASATLLCRLPLIHIAGGHVTEGALDDSVRHAVTKMADLHFTAIDQYRQRIIQLGEMPERVFVVGSTGLDNIATVPLISRADLESEIGFSFGRTSLLVTFHPETQATIASSDQIDELLAALAVRCDANLLFTGSNVDPGAGEIDRRILRFVADNAGRAIFVRSLGYRRYLSALACVNGVIGNSSSGLIEAPSFHVGTINIGDRQKGRIRAESVIDCACTRDAIGVAIDELFSPAFQKKLSSVINPYGDGKAAQRILNVIDRTDFEGLAPKRFHDISFSREGL